MSKSQRTKGQSGERELSALIADLTGWKVKRRVRQHEGDSDLEGVPGWSVEVKRHKTALPGDIRQWWNQACEQTTNADAIPVLFYRADRREWRAVWPLVVLLLNKPTGGIEYTAETSVEAWAMVAREIAA